MAEVINMNGDDTPWPANGPEECEHIREGRRNAALHHAIEYTKAIEGAHPGALGPGDVTNIAGIFYNYLAGLHDKPAENSDNG